MIFAVVLLLFTSGIWCAPRQHAAFEERQRECPTTVVDTFTFGCGEEGWVRAPDVISMSVKQTIEDCGAACHSTAGCKTLRYIESNSKCFLYAKSFADMDTTYDNFLPGLLYDRECFTRNCNIIDSCAATENCKKAAYTTGDGFYFFDYERYACGYGVTARLRNFKYKEKYFKGSLAACEVIEKCARGTGFDTYDVHYHIPSKQWICRQIEDATPVPVYPKDGGYLISQKVNEHRYTARNSSVGAGYGYYCSVRGYND